MKVLHVYNLHRKGGGSDTVCRRTIEISRRRGLGIDEFVRNSADLPPGIRGKASAFFCGLYARGTVREFADYLKTLKSDLVHIHELYPMISPWVVRPCRAVGVPVVMTCYDYRLSCPVATHFCRGQSCHRCCGGREYWAVLRNCRDNLPESVAYGLRNAMSRMFGLYTRHVDCFIVPSPSSRRWLVETVGVADTKVAVIPPPVEAPPQGVDDPSRGQYVAYAGRFVPEKGVELLLEAARLAKLPVRLAGDASTHPAVRPGDDVTFVMTKSPAELAAFYRGARVLAMPSIWHETFGMVAAEALSHGVPVVAARIGALEHTVEDGVTGLHFRPGDVAGLTEALGRVWHDPGLCRRLGAAGRQRVCQMCSEEAFYSGLIAAYRLAGASAA